MIIGGILLCNHAFKSKQKQLYFSNNGNSMGFHFLEQQDLLANPKGQVYCYW